MLRHCISVLNSNNLQPLAISITNSISCPAVLHPKIADEIYIFLGYLSLFATNFCRLNLGKTLKAPVSNLLMYERLNAGAFFVFRQKSETVQSASHDTA